MTFEEAIELIAQKAKEKGVTFEVVPHMMSKPIRVRGTREYPYNDCPLQLLTGHYNYYITSTKVYYGIDEITSYRIIRAADSDADSRDICRSLDRKLMEEKLLGQSAEA